jgi:hypothetical protein
MWSQPSPFGVRLSLYGYTHKKADTPTALVPASAPNDVRRLSETVAGDERPQSESEMLKIEQVGAIASTFT